MSNRLINLAKRVQRIGDRRIHPSEKAVLLALADDARDHLGGRTKDVITNRHIQQATGLSERAVRMAITALAEAGHISRQAGEPGAPMITLVHPGVAADQAVAGAAAVAPPPAAIAGPPGNHCRGSYRIEDNTQNIPSPTLARAREPAAPDEVEQVFSAWDAFQQRVGLPQVARGMARRGAVAARIAEAGLGNTLMVVDRTERARRDGRAPKGQGDLFFSFDMVFGVGRAAALNVFDRMLDGEFGLAKAEPAPAAPPPLAIEEGDVERQVRERARRELGDYTHDAWLATARLQVEGDTLHILTRTAFDADWINSQISDTLRRAAADATRGRVRRARASREHAPAD